MGGFLDWLLFVLSPQVINGLSIGVAVVLMALGLTISFGLLDVINMAHGEFYAIGAYVGVALLAAGVPFWWALGLVPVVMLVVGRRHRAAPGAARLQLEGPAHAHLAAHLRPRHRHRGRARDRLRRNPKRVPAPISGASEVAGLFFPNYRLFVMVFGALLIVAVWLLVYRTSLGAMVRAAAFDRDMAGSLGVPVGMVYAGTFAFGVALAGLAGGCWRRSIRSSRPWAATSC